MHSSDISEFKHLDSNSFLQCSVIILLGLYSGLWVQVLNYVETARFDWALPFPQAQQLCSGKSF